MIYKHNYDVINKILPINCEAYLKNKGWNETGKFGEAARIFGRTDDGGQLHEVLVPTKTDVGDFKSVILNLLAALQDFEDRPLDYVANDIVLAKFDVFRIIAFKGDTSASLPLEDATVMLDKSLSMMASSAQSIITQQPFFQSRRSSEVSNFLSKLRMGHTERGSFVVTLQTPIAPDMSGSLPFPDMEPRITDEPFERKVTTRLCSLLSEANKIANEPDPETLTESVARGMSANFFESLADITEACGETGVNLDMTWASVRPIHPAWNIKSKFIIEKEKVETLREAGRTLRTRVPETNIEIAGYVIALNKGENLERRTIKLYDITTSPPRVISVELGEYYNQAIDAHRDGKIVFVKGDLQKSTRLQNLVNISGFRTAEIDELP